MLRLRNPPLKPRQGAQSHSEFEFELWDHSGGIEVPDLLDCTQAPLSMGFSRQEYWSRLPFPPPGDLPDQGIEHSSLTSPALAGSSLPLVPPGKPLNGYESP